jgi:hypothetical protein
MPEDDPISRNFQLILTNNTCIVIEHYIKHRFLLQIVIYESLLAPASQTTCRHIPANRYLHIDISLLAFLLTLEFVTFDSLMDIFLLLCNPDFAFKNQHFTNF